MAKTIRNTPYTYFRTPRTLQESKSVIKFITELQELNLIATNRDKKKCKPSVTSWDDLDFSLPKFFKK